MNGTTRIPRILALAATAALLALPVAAASDGTAYDRIGRHYEAIRVQLVHDSTAGVAAHAREISKIAAGLTETFDPAAAAVGSSNAEDCLKLLPELRAAADRLAGTRDLASARDAFGSLSTTMVRYRKMAGGDSVVVYCPMTEKAWVQPEGEIGNPYFGSASAMARCGQIVTN